MGRTERIGLHEYEAQRIAIVKPSALGDIVHSLPVLSALRQRYPRAHIAWVVNRNLESLLEGHPDLDATIAFDRAAVKGWPISAARSYGRFLWRLRRERFDLAIDLQGLIRSGIMVAATGARRRVGLGTAREGASVFYTDVVPCPARLSVHAVDRYWFIANALGAGAGPKRFRVPVTEPARAWARNLLADCPRPWLVLAVGARWLTKRWPPEHFAALARQAQERSGGTAIFIGARNEAGLARETADRLVGPVRDLMGRTTLPQLTALLADADLVIANDTGPLHLAHALGRPVVAPYTCTKVALTGPYGAAGSAVESTVWCQGSYRKRCTRLECMPQLTPDHLWPLVQRILEPAFAIAVASRESARASRER